MIHTYRKTPEGKFEVGLYRPVTARGPYPQPTHYAWHAVREYASERVAAACVNYLNGGGGQGVEMGWES